MKDIHTTDSRDDKSYKAFTDSLDEIGYNSTICYNIEHGQKNSISHSNTTTENNSLIAYNAFYNPSVEYITKSGLKQVSNFNIRLNENDTIEDGKRERKSFTKIKKGSIDKNEKKITLSENFLQLEVEQL